MDGGELWCRVLLVQYKKPSQHLRGIDIDGVAQLESIYSDEYPSIPDMTGSRVKEANAR